MKITESRQGWGISVVVRMPLVGSAANALLQSPLVRRLRRRWNFHGSSSYWEQRYRIGGTSGPGSYGPLAHFKADTLNAFVARENIQSVVEFGVGDGAQLELARYRRYVGIDIAPTAIELCSRRFAFDGTKRFYLASQIPADLGRFDLALSLDVIYHLIEDAVFETHMRALFASASRFVIIYSSNKEEVTDWPHVRHRQFTPWIAEHEPHWRLTDHIKNRYTYDSARPTETSFADFYVFKQIAQPDL
ncbi:MAG: class I SAM-dependent methyltransferase [Rhodospirillales bacterium]|nr:class I SAM-dependent methyltransferase [Rhodospirillales bacterium]